MSEDAVSSSPPPALRAAVAWACTLLTFGVLLWNIPIPALQDRYRDRANPLYELTMLDQDWAFFAPDVSQPSWLFHLEVTRDDGSTERIDFPDGDPWVGTFRAYRWSAYEEALLDDEILRGDALEYALDNVERPDEVARVDLILLEAEPPTGDHGPFEPAYERIVYDSLILEDAS